MKCIKCEGTLRLVRIDEVEVDQCDACNGIWFDSGELAKIVGRKDVEALRTKAHASKEVDQKRAACPRCKGEGKLVQIASMTSAPGRTNSARRDASVRRPARPWPTRGSRSAAC